MPFSHSSKPPLAQMIAAAAAVTRPEPIAAAAAVTRPEPIAAAAYEVPRPRIQPDADVPFRSSSNTPRHSTNAWLDVLDACDISEMRLWVSDCVWGDVDDNDYFFEVSDAAIARAVNRCYDGGIYGFLQDTDRANAAERLASLVS